MNVKHYQITYRGFAPKATEVNFSVKKSDVIYRGFRVRDLIEPENLSKSITRIYRGVRVNVKSLQTHNNNCSLQYAA